MTLQIPMPENAVFGEVGEDGATEIAPDLAYIRLSFVNVVFFGLPNAGDRGWTLIDTGIPGSMDRIVEVAGRRFGEGARPTAIVLTHGHFDHVGTVEHLAAHWDAPVYAHPLEHPYLDGGAAYPPADPWVGGGLLALLAPLFPTGPVNVEPRLREIAGNGGVPGMPGWRWLHTPGHAPGQISLWRESDRTVVAGDAFVTTGQESAYEVLLQKPEMHGPPRYFTPDWAAAKRSVQALATLHPELAITGHGPALKGPAVADGLERLAREFDEVALPKDRRYVEHPARAEDGSAYRKP